MSQQYHAELQALGSSACTEDIDETPTHDEDEWVVLGVGPTNVPATDACESKDPNQGSADIGFDVVQEQEGSILLAAIFEYQEESRGKLDAETQTELDDLVEAWTKTKQDSGCAADREFRETATASGWKPEHGLECLSVASRQMAIRYQTVGVLSVRVASRHSDKKSRITWTVSVNRQRYWKVEGVERLQGSPDDWSAQDSARDAINQWQKGWEYRLQAPRASGSRQQ